METNAHQLDHVGGVRLGVIEQSYTKLQLANLLDIIILGPTVASKIIQE